MEWPSSIKVGRILDVRLKRFERDLHAFEFSGGQFHAHHDLFARNIAADAGLLILIQFVDRPAR